MTLDRMETLFARTGSSHTVLLTSFRRNGQGVGTPVGMKARDGKLYFMTSASTWKAKRLAHTPRVRLALCTFKGQMLSPTVEGVARQLTGFEAKQARRWICAGAAGWMINAFYMIRFPGKKTALYEVALLTQEQQARRPA